MRGYLYTFLRSKCGRNLLQGIQFGAVIKHLEPDQIDSLPVPLLDNEAQRSIHDKMPSCATSQIRPGHPGGEPAPNEVMDQRQRSYLANEVYPGYQAPVGAGCKMFP